MKLNTKIIKLGRGFLLAITTLLATTMVSAQINASAGIEGQWQDPEKGIIVEIFERDGRYWGRLISSPDPEQNQKVQEKDEILLLRNFKKQSDTWFCCGEVFQPKIKRTVNAELILKDANSLIVRGKVGDFSSSRTWVRV